MPMKKNLLAASILLAVMGGAGTAVVAEHNADQAKDNQPGLVGASRADGSAATAAGRIKRGPAATVLSGTVKADELETNPAVERARQVLQEEKRQMARAKGANKPADDRAVKAEQYTPRDVMVDADGTEHVRFARTLNSLPVIGGGLVTHTKDGRLQSVSKTLDLQVGEGEAPTPKLSKQQAIVEAGTHFDGKFSDTPDARVVYFADENQPKLAYEVNFRGVKSNGEPANELVYVDAGDGGLLGTDSRVYSAAPAVGQGATINRGMVALSTSQVSSLESGNRGAGFLLRDDLRGGGTVHDVGGVAILNYFDTAGGKVDAEFVNVDRVNAAPIMFDADNAWGSLNAAKTNAQRMGAEAHYGVSKTWDYYLARYARQGISGGGVGVKSFVNLIATYNGVANASASMNAFYSQDEGAAQGEMFYLNGSAGVSNPVVALDVAGHEMSHGVNAATSRLIYDRDAGGLNEANSDIHGALVEFYDNGPLDPPDYMVGETVYVDGHPLRYMFKPSLDGDSHDCYPVGGFGSKAVAAANDPHYTSGVGNHFFYLLAEGQVVPSAAARFNKFVAARGLDCRNRTGLVKAGIGRDAAGKIWYRASTTYFVEQTTYPQARAWTQQAARDLVALGQVNANTVNAVACAWEAVNVALPAGSAEARCVQ